eukprot:512512-Rhodomonas_salina.2
MASARVGLQLVALPYKALSMDEAHLRNLKEVFLSIADPGDDHIGDQQHLHVACLKHRMQRRHGVDDDA